MNVNDIPCDNCGEMYDNDKRKPICLPCGHTFCKSCLNEIWKRLSYIKCPQDNKKHFLKIDDFPINFLVQKIITGDKIGPIKKSTTSTTNLEKATSKSSKGNPALEKKQTKEGSSSTRNKDKKESTTELEEVNLLL